jgi:hypothetical protein
MVEVIHHENRTDFQTRASAFSEYSSRPVVDPLE